VAGLAIMFRIATLYKSSISHSLSMHSFHLSNTEGKMLFTFFGAYSAHHMHCDRTTNAKSEERACGVCTLKGNTLLLLLRQHETILEKGNVLPCHRKTRWSTNLYFGILWWIV
jgi:hypothetical protein